MTIKEPFESFGTKMTLSQIGLSIFAESYKIFNMND